MELDETKHIIRLLTFEWSKVELYAGAMTYSDYMKAVQSLQAITNDVDRTKAIFLGVIQQASALSKSSEWVREELKFEAQAEVIGDRGKWLRVEVAAQDANDAALDLYNERLTRFNSNG